MSIQLDRGIEYLFGGHFLQALRYVEDLGALGFCVGFIRGMHAGDNPGFNNNLRLITCNWNCYVLLHESAGKNCQRIE